jgi:uncharacterized protein
MTEAERPVTDWSRGEPWTQVAETHAAAVFFAGDRACKLKKPVNLGFLDFSTPQARAAACAREVELNREFAPDVYLGVAELRGPDGQVCDHLVVMRRMPAARRLSTLVRSRAPVAGPLRQVARVLASRHAKAARRSPSRAAGTRCTAAGRTTSSRPGRSRRGWRRASRSTPRSSRRRSGWPCGSLAGRAPLFDARIRDGRIADGHGDLLADDIFCLDDGPRILDCLDFDDRLRWLDGLDDAAFLARPAARSGCCACRAT